MSKKKTAKKTTPPTPPAANAGTPPPANAGTPPANAGTPPDPASEMGEKLFQAAAKAAASIGGIVVHTVAGVLADLRERVRRSGLRPDLPDLRDLIADPVFPRGLQLALSVDQRPLDSPVEDQLALGSCTAQMGIGMMEFLDRAAGHARTDLSALALYYYERAAMGTVAIDSGACIRDALKQMAKGVPRLDLCPYDPAKFAADPGEAAAADRPNHQVLDYYRVSLAHRIYQLKAALAQGFAVGCGIMLYESAVTDAVAKTGAVPMPKAGERLIGGHAVRITGYSDLTDTFTFRNSWGPGWGDAGYGFLPQKFVASLHLTSDIWIARKVKA